MQLEVCVDSLESAINAQAGGANRIELCSALSAGGLTPSHGLLSVVKGAVNLPIHAMIRPRPGNFCYSTKDLDVCLEDAKHMVSCQAAGIVFGAITRDGEVDVQFCQSLVQFAKLNGIRTTFHRAFDVSASWQRSLDAVVRLGFDYVLTSGCAPTAPQGVHVLRRVVAAAADRVAIVVGSGVTADNLLSLASATGATHFHASASEQHTDALFAPATSPRFGCNGSQRVHISSVEKVGRMASLLAEL